MDGAGATVAASEAAALEDQAAQLEPLTRADRTERLVMSSEPLPDPHDLGLLEVTLSLSPQERIERLIALHRAAERLRSAPRQ